MAPQIKVLSGQWPDKRLINLIARIDFDREIKLIEQRKSTLSRTMREKIIHWSKQP